MFFSPLPASNAQTNTSENQAYSLLLGLVTVIFFYLAFPSGGIAELTWFVMVPIIIALNRMCLRNAFVLGLLTATLGWMSSIWWAVIGVAEITSSTFNVALPLVFFFCFISAIPYACACWLHVRLSLGNSLSGAFASATLFTVLVNYTPQILPGNLAHALYLQPIFIQLADIGGVALVFFLIHCVNILIANGVSLIKVNKRNALHCFAVAFILFVSNIGYGYYKNEAVQSATTGQQKALRVAVLQPNIDITNRTRDEWLHLQQNLSSLLLAVNEEQTVDLAVFPEVPVPISYRYYAKDKIFFDQYFLNLPLLLTAINPLNEDIEDGGGYFNTMELIEKQDINQSYAKQVLLPFGEYLPFEEQLPWLRNVFPFAPDYRPGNQPTLFTIRNAQGENITVIPLICYEAVFSEQVAAGVAQGGEVIINSSNDAWFSHIAGKKVHLALSLFRSVEYRKYLIRVTNTGLSMVISPYGDIVEDSKLTPNKQSFAVVEVSIAAQQSFYQQYPNAIKVIFIIIGMFIFIYCRTRYDNN